jgi:hypothetical protein
LAQHVEQAAAEQRHQQPRPRIGDGEIHAGPHEVDDDAQVRQLDGEPHVGPAGQQLKPAARLLNQVENDVVDVGHRR